ncbi:MAG: dihydrofolate reductase [Alphaproteobacteria bacterium]|nr:dihydrofolate reductase [Alphaproteobacteria bacterium]
MKAALTLIVARARNGVIGKDGALPWRISSDMKLFKARTMGKPVLMGRKTWDSFPRRPLPGRPNLVLSQGKHFRADGGWVFSSLDTLLAAGRAMAQNAGVDEVCVLGGAQLYAQTLPLADRIVLTEVDLAPEGDTHFVFDETAWREVSAERVAAGPKDDAAFVVRVLERARR